MSESKERVLADLVDARGTRRWRCRPPTRCSRPGCGSAGGCARSGGGSACRRAMDRAVREAGMIVVWVEASAGGADGEQHHPVPAAHAPRGRARRRWPPPRPRSRRGTRCRRTTTTAKPPTRRSPGGSRSTRCRPCRARVAESSVSSVRLTADSQPQYMNTPEQQSAGQGGAAGAEGVEPAERRLDRSEGAVPA